MSAFEVEEALRRDTSQDLLHSVEPKHQIMHNVGQARQQQAYA